MSGFLKPHQGELLGLAEVGLVEVTFPSAVGIPVPVAMAVLTTSGQGALEAVKGKRAGSWLCEPRVPGLRANLKSWEALMGALGRDQAISDHPGNRMACHMTHAPHHETETGNNPCNTT